MKATTLRENIAFELEDTTDFERHFEEIVGEGEAGDEEDGRLARIYQVVGEHDIFVTEKGRLGVVARDTVQQGDHILVFGSAHCPFVARKLQLDGQRAFTLRSPCYVDGECIATTHHQ